MFFLGATLVGVQLRFVEGSASHHCNLFAVAAAAAVAVADAASAEAVVSDRPHHWLKVDRLSLGKMRRRALLAKQPFVFSLSTYTTARCSAPHQCTECSSAAATDGITVCYSSLVCMVCI